MLPPPFCSRLLFVVVLLMAGGVGAAQPEDSFECPKLSKKLSTAEVFEGRMAALREGNLDLAFCYYAEDAVVVMPGSVIRGREQVKAGFVSFGALFGGQLPQLSSLTVEGDVVLVTFSITGDIASIEDGADTFIIRDGRIQSQTVHASIVFHAR
jgi:ketosteroid isomerase-like protein